MITYKNGNLLEDDAEALINTVNCVGVMGRGIALAFRKAFPDNYLLYLAACVAGQLKPGELFVVADFNLLAGQKVIINFPTKTDWRLPSQYAYVDSGLLALLRYIDLNPIRSIAMPALGCGNGGLDWPVVREMIEYHLGGIETDVRIYLPG